MQDSAMLVSQRSISQYPSVLVVDDDAMNIYVLKSMLNEKGVKCDQALSGSEALLMVKERLRSISGE